MKILVPPIRSFALKKNLIDIPDKRKIHTGAIPRIGGVSIFISFCLTQFLLILIPQKDLFFSTTNNNLITIYLSATLFFLLGLFDDLYKIKALKRLFLQFFISFLSWKQGIALTSIEFPFEIANNYLFILLDF